MKKFLKTYLPVGGLLFLAWLAFVDNIAIGPGDDYSYISEEEFFEGRTGLFCSNSDESVLIDLADYADFDISTFPSSGKLIRETFMDTTGDGNKELVKSVIEVSNGKCLVQNSIERSGNKLWDEEITLFESDLKIYFGDNALDKSKALAYLGLIFSHFTEVRNGSNSSQLLSAISRFQIDTNFLAFADLKQQLESNSGSFIFRRNPANQGIYLWNQESERFEEVLKLSAEA